jgi:NADPH-dependent glutamate synthase beta subunit-like oxidoreductase
VVDCLSFLREANTRGEVSVGRRVAVIGGGSAAMDAARTALRVGVEDVHVLYRRVRQDMPAAPEEVREAAEEGIEFQFLTVPTGIEPEKGHLRVECRRMEPGPVDASGRRRPVPVEGPEFSLHVDTVIVAIGQRSEALGGMESEMDRRGRLQVERFTQQTTREGVFAAGDLVRGPSSIIEAIADGREAASDIDRYLGGTGEIELSFAPEEDLEGIEMIEEEEERPRLVMRTRPPAERKKDFAEVQLGFTEEQALQEAARCLRCDLEDVEEE